MEAWVPELWDLGRILVMLAICLGLAGPLTWAERRQAAMMQDRVGPNRAALALFGREVRAFGLFHPIADVIKLITKEDTINIHADRFLYNLAPLVAMLPAMVTFAVVPFGPDITIGGEIQRLQVARIDGGMIYVFAVSSIAVFGIGMAGYASASKFSILGGLRAAAQMLSYEVSLGLSVMGLFLIFETLEPYAMVQAQGELIGGWIPKWGIVVQPLAFILFLAAAIAENKRTPFDVVEGESEIIGYFVEYSGMKFGMFYMAEYIELIVIAGLVTTLFFGGWQVPYLVTEATASGLWHGFHFPWGARIALGPWVMTALQIGAFFGKLLFFCWFQLALRWTLPRFRYDQIMNLGWKRLLPIALLNLMVTAAVVLALA